MYEEQPTATTEIDRRPLDVRIGDKNWKTRMTAYEDLKVELKKTLGDDPLFEEYASWIPKMTADSNAGAMDAGLDTALLFVDMCPNVNLIRQFADAVCGNVIDKAFGTRAGTLNKGKQLIMKLIEVDDASTCSTIMLSKLGDKKPKVPPTCLELFKEGIVAYGARAFPIKELIAAMGPILNGSNGAARELALAVMVELQRWIGKAPFNTLVDSLRPAQKTEFEKLCADTEGAGTPVPTVYLRKSRPAPGSEPAVAESKVAVGKAKASGPAEGTLDAREFMEEIDLAKRLKASEYDTLIAEEKWSEQLRGLQIILDILGPTPKLKPGTDVGDILAVCKGFLRQGHVQLQVSSLKILGLLADGLRAEFGSSVRPLTQAIIQKTKEKRLCPEVQSSLITILRYCVTMDVLIDDLAEHIKGKKIPPHARVCLMEFICSCIQTCPERVSTDSLKPLVEMNISCCEDSDVKVRESCSTTLAALAQLVRTRGRNAVEAHRLLMGLEQSAPRIFKRMQSAMSDALPAAAAAVAVPPPPQKQAAPPAPPTKKPSTGAGPTKSASMAVKRQPSGGASAGRAPTVSAAGADENDDNVDDVTMSLEDAQVALSVLSIPNWDGSFQSLMSSSKWQEKVDACTTLGEAIQTQSAGASLSVPLVAYLKAHHSNFKISNVSVAKAVLQLVTTAAQSLGAGQKFSKSAAWELIKAFGDRFSDKKTLESATSFTTAMCEATSPAFVIKRMKSVMDKTKAPVAHQYYLEWMKGAIAEFGATAFPVQHVASFCREEMENKVAAVRTAAVEVVGALYNQLGPRVQSIAVSDDCKPQLRTLLEAEFAKVGYDPAAMKKATRAVKGDDAAAGGGLSIPRQDICSNLDKNILQELNFLEGKNSWQNRKAAMEAIIAGCEKSGHYLEANKGTAEMLRALRARLNDTQANLKPIAATAIAHITTSLEIESAVKMLRPICSALVSSVADSKKAMRDAAISAFEMIVTINGTLTAADPSLMAVMLTSSVEALANPVGRQELLQWVATHADGNGVRCDCNELADPLVLCLQDKMAVVRTLAETVLTSLISKGLINRGAIDKATRDLPQATKRALQGPLDRMLASYGTKRVTIGTASTAPEEPAPAPVHATAPAVAASHTNALPKSTSLKASTSVAVSIESVETPTESDPSGMSSSFKKGNKARRNDEFYKQSWPIPPEDISENELATLRREWETFISNPDMVQVLFPVIKFGNASQESYLGGITELLSFMQNSASQDVAILHTDFILRWCAYVLCSRETAQGLLKVLQLITEVFELHKTLGVPLHDAEASIILPHLLDKSGHKSERHKAAFKSALEVAELVCPAPKMCSYLIQGLGAKNKKTRAVCLEELERVVTLFGYAPLGKSGLREVGAVVDSKDSDVGVRNAALDLVYSIYACIGGSDTIKLYKLLGDISDKAKTLIEHRIKEKNKNAPVQHAPAATQAPVAALKQAVAPPTNALSPNRPPAKTIKTEEIASDKKVVLRGGVSRSFDGGASIDPVGSLPFKLDMTPPSSGEHQGGYSAAKVTSSPVVEDLKVSLFGKSTPPQSSTSVDIGGVYGEIAQKVNLMISLYSSYLQQKQAGKTPVASKELVSSCDDCREYLKMLHSLVTGDWAKAGVTPSSAAEDERVLLQNSEGIMVMVLTCLSLGFEGIGVSSRTPSEMPVATALDIDVSLVSVCLATLHALVRHSGLVERLSHKSLVELVSDCTLAVSNEKMTRVISNADAREACEQIHRVLLLILAKTAQESGTARMINAVLQPLFQCISEVNHEIVGDSTVTKRLLPRTCSKPLSKLLLKVLSDECKQPRAFLRLSVDERSSMLLALHKFFSGHPAEVPSDDTPFCAAKTVLAQLVKSIGAASILMTLQESLSIPPSSFVCRLTAKLGGSDGNVLSEKMAVTAAEEVGSYQTNAVSPELHGLLVSIIDEITSSRDKLGPIRKLHVLIKNNPTLDVTLYLQRISSVFRKYVLDTLVRLDQQDTSAGVLANPTSSETEPNNIENKRTVISTSSGVLKPISRDDVMTSNEGFEAMRIIEGLKFQQKFSNSGSDSSRLSTSANRAAIHSKIRGSLNSLTESLNEAGVPVAAISSSNYANIGSAAAAPSTSVSTATVPGKTDEDLAARIARIRNANNKA